MELLYEHLPRRDEWRASGAIVLAFYNECLGLEQKPAALCNGILALEKGYLITNMASFVAEAIS